MAEKKYYIKDNFIGFPIKMGMPTRKIEVFYEDEKIYEFMVPMDELAEDYQADYYACVPVGSFKGQELILRGSITEAFFNAVKNMETEFPEDDGSLEGKALPSLHFIPRHGWMNDPNGLVYKDGIYHMYFQYNPFDINWENMCWGHAVSSDLLNWKQCNTVMYPDQYGYIFSGSGLVVGENLVFYYTAAGQSGDWVLEKRNTQRKAISRDGGYTLEKQADGILPNISYENRDPKVFWHEETSAYVMILWIEANEFGIYRSKDLLIWEESQRLQLEGGYECPDLISLGGGQWVIITADGYAYFGSFDGFTFHQEETRRELFLNKAPYAAQSFSGIKDRIVWVPWLRICGQMENAKTAGVMGLPRQLELVFVNGKKTIALKPVREFYMVKDKGIRVGDYDCKEGDNVWTLGNTDFYYNSQTGVFKMEDQEEVFPKNITDFSIIIDGNVVEVSANSYSLLGAFALSKK